MIYVPLRKTYVLIVTLNQGEGQRGHELYDTIVLFRCFYIFTRLIKRNTQGK